MNEYFDIDEELDEINNENDEYVEYKSVPKDYEIKLNEDYKKWIKVLHVNHISDEKVKDAIFKDLNFLSNLTVQEYTLYKKYKEIKLGYKYSNESENSLSGLFDCSFDDDYGKYNYLKFIKNNIWIPNQLDDYKKLKPVLILSDKNIIPELKKYNEWMELRTFSHTMINNSNIGRNIMYTVIDDNTGKYLGEICVSSDFMDLTPRDNFIGWNREIKTSKKMINHTAIASTILPTQPFGYNYLGGKLLALLSMSDRIEQDWKKQYGDRLVGVTTTSLYETYSQYTNLKYWNTLGKTNGTIKFEPEKDTLKLMLNWLKYYYPRKYWEWYVASEPGGMPLKRDNRQRSFAFIYSKLEIPKEITQANHSRGIFFCPLFYNTNEFLQMKINESALIKMFDNSIETLTELWKDKYASKRIESLKTQNRVNLETLFYMDIIKMNSWEEVRDKYINQVGKGKIDGKAIEQKRQIIIKNKKQDELIERQKRKDNALKKWLETATPEQLLERELKIKNKVSKN